MKTPCPQLNVIRFNLFLSQFGILTVFAPSALVMGFSSITKQIKQWLHFNC